MYLIAVNFVFLKGEIYGTPEQNVINSYGNVGTKTFRRQILWLPVVIKMLVRDFRFEVRSWRQDYFEVTFVVKMVKCFAIVFISKGKPLIFRGCLLFFWIYKMYMLSHSECVTSVQSDQHLCNSLSSYLAIASVA